MINIQCGNIIDEPDDRLVMIFWYDWHIAMPEWVLARVTHQYARDVPLSFPVWCEIRDDDAQSITHKFLRQELLDVMKVQTDAYMVRTMYRDSTTPNVPPSYDGVMELRVTEFRMVVESMYEPGVLLIDSPYGEHRIDLRDIASVLMPDGAMGLSWWLRGLSNVNMLPAMRPEYQIGWWTKAGELYGYEEFAVIENANGRSLASRANFEHIENNWPDDYPDLNGFFNLNGNRYSLDSLSPISLETGMALRNTLEHLAYDYPTLNDDIYYRLEAEMIDNAIDEMIDYFYEWFYGDYIDEEFGHSDNSEMLIDYWDDHELEWKDRARDSFGTDLWNEIEVIDEGFGPWVSLHFDDEFLSEWKADMILWSLIVGPLMAGMRAVQREWGGQFAIVFESK